MELLELTVCYCPECAEFQLLSVCFWLPPFVTAHQLPLTGLCFFHFFCLAPLSCLFYGSPPSFPAEEQREQKGKINVRQDVKRGTDACSAEVSLKRDYW